MADVELCCLGKHAVDVSYGRGPEGVSRTAWDVRTKFR